MADTTPPLPPVIAATPISGQQINLSWSTASDDVVKYEVRRNGKLISTQTTTKYADDGDDLLPAGLVAGHTYTYVVVAFDLAGNFTPSVPTVAMTQWWPLGYDLPAFRVQREVYGLATGGDYVRGSSVSTLPRTALRYQSSDEVVADTSTAVGKALLFTTPLDYNTIKIYWRWPAIKADTWQEVALVRSSFGHPSTPRDGQTVFRALRTEFEADATGLSLSMPPMVFDMPLPSGNWYYYTVFFRTKNDWVASMSDSCLLPKDYLHREHMWNAIPPYYQWIDNNYRDGMGHLRQFLTVFGFEMDNTRAFIEGVLDLHRLDKTPMALLGGLGANYGLPYESGIGDIRYRGLVANTPNAQHWRGTATGLKQVIEAVSKYETQITGSQTLMLFPDDSDFKNGTGSWGGLHPDAVNAVDPLVNPNIGSSVRVTGTLGSYIAGPLLDLVAVKTFKWEIDVSMDDWTPVANKCLAHQYADPVKSWEVLSTTTNTANALVSTNGTGTSPLTYTSTSQGYIDGSRHVVGGTWIHDTGAFSTVQFTSDGAALGGVVQAGRQTIGMINGSGPIDIGRDHLATVNSHVLGNIYGMRLWADGVLIASPDFTKMVAGQRRVTDLQGNHWDLQGAAAVVNPIAALLPWDAVYVARVNKAAPVGRGVMRLYTSKANETVDFIVPCGDSRLRNDGEPIIVRTDGLTIDPTHPAPDTVPPAPTVGEDGLTYTDAIPLTAGVAIGGGKPYGFSVWVDSPEKLVKVQAIMIWIGPSGSPHEVVGVSIGAPYSLTAGGGWVQALCKGIAPSRTAFAPEARYLIPALQFYDREAHTWTNRSAAMDVAGAMLYPLGDDAASVSIVPPDRYLTLGNPAEKIGVTKTGYEGFVLGSPQKGM